jgi:hypothetical protein
LNPDDDISFHYEGRQIDFKHKDWDTFDQWQDDIWSNELNQFLFNDILLSCSDDPFPNINNPIFSTNGEKEKMWSKENDMWTLEKRLDDEDLVNEINCLTFFEQYGVLTPKHTTIHHNVTNRYQFEPDTIQDGFNTIKKQCLTSKTHQLTPLSWYISENCEDSVHGVLEQAKNALQIDLNILNGFERAICEYQSVYSYRQIDTSNLGFLVDCDNNAIPAVWSAVGYVEKNPFIAMTI